MRSPGPDRDRRPLPLKTELPSWILGPQPDYTRARLNATALRAGGHGMRSELMTRFEDQLLNPPIQEFGDVDFGFRGASDFVDPAKLLELFA